MGKISNFFIANPENEFQPKILNFKVIFVVALALGLTRLLLPLSVAESVAVNSSTLMSLINNERSQRNLPTLLTHQSLVGAANIKAQDMIDRDYFAHIDPDGKYIWNEIVAAGYSPYKILGENLAVDFSTSEGMVQAWIDSPTHRGNLLHPDFVNQGLTAIYGDYQGRYTNLTASLFGALAISTPTPPPPPPPPPPVVTPPVQSETITAPPETPETENVVNPTVSKPTGELEKPVNLSPPENTPEDLLNPGFPTNQTPNNPRQLDIVRLVFTIFGIGFLAVLIVDSIIIYRNETKTSRGHPSYHLFIFVLLVLVSLLVWWWS